MMETLRQSTFDAWGNRQRGNWMISENGACVNTREEAQAHSV